MARLEHGALVRLMDDTGVYRTQSKGDATDFWILTWSPCDDGVWGSVVIATGLECLPKRMTFSLLLGSRSVKLHAVPLLCHLSH